MARYVFGPVPSRRLGISLGMDIVIPKSCNLNCVFCECGPTKDWTVERKHFISFEDFKQELEEALQQVKPDYVTFSGSGEPTLSLDLGKIIRYIKQHYSVKIAVITNSLLLYREDVLEEIQEADLIMPSLHTVKQEVFEKIGRACPGYRIELLLEGLRKLSSRFQGEIDLELFLIEGINTSLEDLKEYADFVKTLSYRKLQLNSLDRPGTEAWVKPVTYPRLLEIKKYLQEQGVRAVEIIGTFTTREKIEENEDRLKAMQERRKYSEEEIKSLYK
ncbi:radical SAM protein [Fusobacterium necrophorum]|uniref:radical SAM protein n=1 Tax=Fusobacterium necrophorum TaxID=859 RepID=UPI00370E19F7